MDDQVLGNLESLVFKNPTNSSVFPDASGYLRFRASGQLDSPGKIAFYRGDSSGSLEYTVEEN